MKVKRIHILRHRTIKASQATVALCQLRKYNPRTKIINQDKTVGLLVTPSCSQCFKTNSTKHGRKMRNNIQREPQSLKR